MRSNAIMSPDDKHRYMLSRVWDDTKGIVMFIGLNPSRADDKYNDPTITRCINFAKSWGFGGMFFANLYSFRTPYPNVLIENINDAVGVLCDMYLLDMIMCSDKIVCCWGSWNFIQEREKKVLSMIKSPYCFGLNKDGHPKHPLYLKSTSLVEPLKI